MKSSSNGSKNGISVGKSRARVKRGRPANIRRLNRQRVFALFGQLVSGRGMAAWVRAAKESLSSWDNARCRPVFEAVGLIVGEGMASGARGFNPDPEQIMLPFDRDDSAKIIHAPVE